VQRTLAFIDMIMLICDETMSCFSDMRLCVCVEFFAYNEVDFVYILGRHEGVACSSFCTSCDNEGIPNSVSHCSNFVS